MEEFGEDPKVVPLALARLERMIQARLRSQHHAPGQQLMSVKLWATPDQETGEFTDIPNDPAFYERIVDSIVDKLDGYVADEAELFIDPRQLGEDRARLDDPPPRDCDFFAARLRCLDCGHVTRADDSSHCETFVRAEPDGTELRIGLPIAIDFDRIPKDYYVRVETPPTDRPLHVIEGWECPRCHCVNWAEVVVADGLIRSIWSIELTREAVGRAHLVTSECVEIAAGLTGRPAWQLLDEDILQILFEEL